MLLNVEYKAGGVEYATLSTVDDKTDIGRNLISNGYALVEQRRDRRLQTMVADYKDAQESAKKSRVSRNH